MRPHITLALLILLLAGCSTPKPDSATPFTISSSSSSSSSSPPSPDWGIPSADELPAADVPLAELPAERSPQAKKLDSWRRQLERKQKELEDFRSMLEGREQALPVDKAGWQKGKIFNVSVEQWSGGGSLCILELLMDWGEKRIRVEADQAKLREFCGSDDLSCLIDVEVWYGERKVASERPGGLLDINMVERKVEHKDTGGDDQ
jgi:hypothetical protein